MIGDDDEEEERRRQARERARLSPIDRLHGAPPRVTASGFVDQRSTKRKGRIVQLGLRLHPRVKAMLDLIIERDQPPSIAVLFEEMIEAYCRVRGPIDKQLLPSDEELARRLEEERDKRDGE